MGRPRRYYCRNQEPLKRRTHAGKRDPRTKDAGRAASLRFVSFRFGSVQKRWRSRRPFAGNCLRQVGQQFQFAFGQRQRQNLPNVLERKIRENHSARVPENIWKICQRKGNKSKKGNYCVNHAGNPIATGAIGPRFKWCVCCACGYWACKFRNS